MSIDPRSFFLYSVKGSNYKKKIMKNTKNEFLRDVLNAPESFSAKKRNAMR
jgi:hypothetical protein